MATVNKYKYEDVVSRQANTVAFFVMLAFHFILFALLYTNGFQVIYPLPIEKGIEVSLEDNLDRKAGLPRTKNPIKTAERPPIVNTPGNSAPSTAKLADSEQSTRPMTQPDAKSSELSDHGDIDKQVEKPKEPEIRPKAIFNSDSHGTEDAENPKTITDNRLYSGVGTSDQSTRSSTTPIGPEHRQMITPNLEGRSVVGTLPVPSYNSQNQGRVVVQITVDQNGKVTKANVLGVGTTVQDAELWKAAEQAAMRATFNVKKDAPIFQLGTITYVFQLN